MLIPVWNVLDEKDDSYRLSQEQAIHMLMEHDVSISEFYEDCGKRESYPVYTVLEWLGY